LIFHIKRGNRFLEREAFKAWNTIFENGKSGKSVELKYGKSMNKIFVPLSFS